MDREQYIIKQAQIAMAQDEFWSYCKYTLPAFYKEHRTHLKHICDVLQALYEGRIRKKKGGQWIIFPDVKSIPKIFDVVCKRILLNAPPRHGKTVTVQKFCEWMLGKKQENRVITISYNDLLSGRLSKQVRDNIEFETIKEEQLTFRDVFEGVKIKYGDSAQKLWALEGQFFNYLGGSPHGTITGVGCNIGIIDDLIKNKYEAYNENILEGHWDFYVNTFLSRLEEGAFQIVVMTRWNSRDLCGRLLSEYGDDWFQIMFQAHDEKKNEMLCPDLLSKESFDDKKKLTSPQIILANYQQVPIDYEGRLYKRFKLYEYKDLELDALGRLKFDKIICRVDTADEGDDYLCAIVFGMKNQMAYLLGVYYTDEGMEVTEPELAHFIQDNRCDLAIIESNNGGAGFSRNVQRISREIGNLHTQFQWFHESLNKQARIVSNSHSVMERIAYPSNWYLLWPQFYEDILRYQKEGTNKHDDAPDCLTGVVEYVEGRVYTKMGGVILKANLDGMTENKQKFEQ